MKIRVALWCLNVAVIAAAAAAIGAQTPDGFADCAGAPGCPEAVAAADSFRRGAGFVPGVLRVLPRPGRQGQRARGAGDESDGTGLDRDCQK